MVLKKELHCRFNGYQIPFVPRAPRSRRGLQRKSVDRGQVCAFELLAAVAGKLLLESSSAAGGKCQLHGHGDGVKEEQIEEAQGFKSECFDQGSCIESLYVPEHSHQENNLKCLKELPHSMRHSVAENSYVYESAEVLKNEECDVKLDIGKYRNAIKNYSKKAEQSSSDDPELCDNDLENRNKINQDAVWKQAGNLTVANSGNLEELKNCVSTHVLINSDRNAQLPLYRDTFLSGSFPRHRNDVNLGIRDDGENSFGCEQPRTKARMFR